MRRPVLETEVALVVFWVKDTTVSNHFHFVAAFPAWTQNMNAAYGKQLQKTFGRQNVRWRLITRRAALD